MLNRPCNASDNEYNIKKPIAYRLWFFTLPTIILAYKTKIKLLDSVVFQMICLFSVSKIWNTSASLFPFKEVSLLRLY